MEKLATRHFQDVLFKAIESLYSLGFVDVKKLVWGIPGKFLHCKFTTTVVQQRILEEVEWSFVSHNSVLKFSQPPSYL